LGVNERNVKKNIKALKDAGLIERVGSGQERALGGQPSGSAIMNMYDALAEKIIFGK
jgi:predicted MarR family transcription regulator